MKINRRWLRTGLIIIALLSVLTALLYVNSLVDYNRDVKGRIEMHIPLNAHQQNIIDKIDLSRYAFAVCLIALVVIIVVKTAEPGFKGKLKYYGE
jgi:hypothetical protein